MSIASVWSVPASPSDWRWWGNNHWQDHQEIAAAINARGLGPIWVPPLDPVPIGNPDALERWLGDWHSQVHQLMDGALGLPGQDLSSVDFQDPTQKSVWINLNAQAHQNYRVTLGI